MHPHPPALDPEFLPFALWKRDFLQRATHLSDAPRVAMALTRPDGSGSIYRTRMLPESASNHSENFTFLERTLKFLLWQRGGSRVHLLGCDSLVDPLATAYSEGGARHFDFHFFSRIYGQPLEIQRCDTADLPSPRESDLALGRHLDGCRIGFDLGGSDRKAAALIDGEVVYSEEIEWDPYFQEDPDYHLRGIRDSLQRAAAHLPRVDAIGGSAAGVYVRNEVRAASLFRGVAPDLFESRVRFLFHDLQKEWGGIPFEVVNDGEVTALAGSMDHGVNGVLGLSLGTSQAAGYVTKEGRITPWLNELAFAPVDLNPDAPEDEWSGDRGCGVQYFSQQAMPRLTQRAGLNLPEGLPLAQHLLQVQAAVAREDPHATEIYATLGRYLGHSLAHYADFYDISLVLLLGRVTSGVGGELLAGEARDTLTGCFPELAEKIEIHIPDEAARRHGQAIAAASLPRSHRPL